MAAQANLGNYLSRAFGWAPDYDPIDRLEDRILDALDDAPIRIVRLSDKTLGFRGPIATIQDLAAALQVSDSTARRAVLKLHRRGLVRIWDVLDPSIKHRRFFVTGLGFPR